MVNNKDTSQGQPDALEIRANNLENTILAPLSREIIKAVIDQQYQLNFGDSNNIPYNIQRGVKELLTNANDYAQLPNLPNGQPALEFFQQLPEGSTFLDVGCGAGRFIKGILGRVNPYLEAYSFDAKQWDKNNPPPNLKLGNIDDLPSINFGRAASFDIITCASVLYHLPDYWGAILRMAHKLKPTGVLLTSTIPRIVQVTKDNDHIIYGKPADNALGELIAPDYGQLMYYRSRNIFGTDGKIIPMSVVIQQIQRENPSWQFKYTVAPSTTLNAQQYGGQIAAIRGENAKCLDLSCLYYCSFPVDRNFGPISYILAQNPNDHNQLRKRGFISVQDRLS